jgi:hypothetical protein
MAISRISSASDFATSVSPASVLKGDCMIAAAFRTNNTSASLPSGWIGITAAGTNNLSLRLGFRIAQSDGEGSGTWTNATGLSVIVLRASVGTIAVPAGTAQTAGTTATVSYGAVTGVVAADNWIDQTFVMFGSTLNDTLAIETAPSLTTFIEKQSQSGLAFANFQLTTNAFGNWATTMVTLAASSTTRTGVVRIAEYPFPALGGGGYRPVNIRGGADQ